MGSLDSVGKRHCVHQNHEHCDTTTCMHKMDGTAAVVVLHGMHMLGAVLGCASSLCTAYLAAGDGSCCCTTWRAKGPGARCSSVAAALMTGVPRMLVLAHVVVSWEKRVVLIISYSSSSSVETGARLLDNLDL